MILSTHKSIFKSLTKFQKFNFENLIQRPVDLLGVNAIINFKTHL